MKTPSTLSNIMNDDDSLSIKKVENIDFMDLLIIWRMNESKNGQNDDQNH